MGRLEDFKKLKQDIEELQGDKRLTLESYSLINLLFEINDTKYGVLDFSQVDSYFMSRIQRSDEPSRDEVLELTQDLGLVEFTEFGVKLRDRGKMYLALIKNYIPKMLEDKFLSKNNGVNP